MEIASEVIEIAPKLALTYSSATQVKKTRKSLTLKTKLDIIKRVENGERKSDVANSLGLAKSTVRTIVQNKDTICDSARRCTPLTSRKITVTRNHVLENMERHLCSWINELNEKNLPVTQRVIMDKARVLYKELLEQDVDDPINANIPFLASRGWFDRFRKRVNLKNVKVQPDGSQLLAFDDVSTPLFMLESSEPVAVVATVQVPLKPQLEEEHYEEEHPMENVSTVTAMDTQETFIITEIPEEETSTVCISSTTQPTSVVVQQIFEVSKPQQELFKESQIKPRSISPLPTNIPNDELHRAFSLLDEVVEIFRQTDPVSDRSKNVARSLHAAVSCYINMYRTDDCSDSDRSDQEEPSSQKSPPLLEDPEELRIKSIEEISSISDSSSSKDDESSPDSDMS